MLYDDDADLGRLNGKTVAIIGYGSQGHAHALNLKESGVNVVVGLRSDSASVAKAKEQGLEVLEPAEAAAKGDLVMILVPDELQGDLYRSDIAPASSPATPWCSPTASQSISVKSFRLRASTASLLRRRVRVISFAVSTPRVWASPVSSRFSRMRRATPVTLRLRMPRASAAPAPV
jgi:hypothetical protein